MIKAISEVHKSDSEIGTKMDPVDTENKNEIKVACNVAVAIPQKFKSLYFREITKTIENQN